MKVVVVGEQPLENKNKKGLLFHADSTLTNMVNILKPTRLSVRSVASITY